MIRTSISRTAAGAFLALAPDASRDIIAAVDRAAKQSAVDGNPSSVLLAAPDTRRFIRRLIQTDLPDIKVICAAELLPEIALESAGMATIANL